ncbi:hypothetical protein IAI10_09975 [Clostridium sp. 19966]|uniref:hypothetical protein n=1 Tax=Clostridium sp. 19966 TaxID=2768166 RepID=UPI0028DF3D68|nr:hypothetical protein [Clostridium sp. 19966]MDT8716985.1 hypothetical protein [Clostridium sp. 19966]
MEYCKKNPLVVYLPYNYVARGGKFKISTSIIKFLIGIILFIITLVVYEVVFKIDYLNYFNEQRTKHKAKVIVTSIIMIISLFVLYGAEHIYSIDTYYIYLIFFILFFRSTHDTVLFFIFRFKLSEKNACKKFKDNKQFQYYHSVLQPILWTFLICSIVSFILQGSSKSFRQVYLPIGKMMFLLMATNYSMSAIRLNMEYKKIYMKKIKGINKLKIYFNEVISLLKTPFLIIVIAMVIIYALGFIVYPKYIH